MSEVKKRKTWNREVAMCLLGFLCYLAFEGNREVLEVVVWPFTIFSMAAFGFKQPAIEGYFTRNEYR